MYELMIDTSCIVKLAAAPERPKGHLIFPRTEEEQHSGGIPVRTPRVYTRWHARKCCFHRERLEQDSCLLFKSSPSIGVSRLRGLPGTSSLCKAFLHPVAER